MNVRLNDGTVRCDDHFDASSYVSVTDDPCLYCPAVAPVSLVKVDPVCGICGYAVADLGTHWETDCVISPDGRTTLTWSNSWSLSTNDLNSLAGWFARNL